MIKFTIYRYLFISQFSGCSVCVQELMYMAYSMLQEATESSTESAVQIFFSVRKMFEMYSCVYPTYHEKSLIMFPQQSGE